MIFHPEMTFLFRYLRPRCIVIAQICPRCAPRLDPCIHQSGGLTFQVTLRVRLSLASGFRMGTRVGLLVKFTCGRLSARVPCEKVSPRL